MGTIAAMDSRAAADDLGDGPAEANRGPLMTSSLEKSDTDSWTIVDGAEVIEDDDSRRLVDKVNNLRTVDFWKLFVSLPLFNYQKL